jgi:hypothetical protein
MGFVADACSRDCSVSWRKGHAMVLLPGGGGQGTPTQGLQNGLGPTTLETKSPVAAQKDTDMMVMKIKSC